MEESVAMASRRLELLSTTAMMKKVLDRAGQLTDVRQTNGVQQPRREIDLTAIEKEGTKEQECHRLHPGAAVSYSQEVTSSPHYPVLSERPMRSSFAHSLLLRSAYDRYGSTVAPPGGCSPAVDDTPYRGQPESLSLQFHHHPAGTATPSARIPAVHGCHPGAAGNETYFFDPNLAAASASPAAVSTAVRFRTKENITPIQMNAHPIQVNPPPGAGQSMLARSMSTEDVQCTAMYAPKRTTDEETVDPTTAAAGVVRPSYEVIANENIEMRRQLRAKEVATIQLQERIASLEQQISELRQLPTGKISHIPIE